MYLQKIQKKYENKTLFSIKLILKNISLLNKQGFNYHEKMDDLLKY